MGRAPDAGQPDQLLLRVHEAGALLSIGRTKTYELISRGELRVVHIDGAARAPVRSVDEYLERLLAPPRRRVRRAARQRDLSQPELPFDELTEG